MKSVLITAPNADASAKITSSQLRYLSKINSQKTAVLHFNRLQQYLELGKTHLLIKK